MKNYKYIFSVIVPTYNRFDEIQELLNSLKKQSIKKDKFEIVIVDDGSTDNTERYISELIRENFLNIRFFKQNHKGPGPARNLGMENALGEYFIFVDSDCIANENWLSSFEKIVSEEKVAGFGGPDKVLPNFSPLQKAIDYSMTSFITTGGMRGHSKKKISKYYPRSFNMGVRADVVEKIGGMNKLRHGQDIEFAHRMISTGGKVVKVLDAIVYHKRRTSIRKFFKQVFNWGVARINLFKIDRGMLEFIHFFPLIGTLVSTIMIVLAILFPNIFVPFIIAGILLLFGMSVHGIFRYSDWRVFFYIPIVVPAQIFAYGIGFGFAFIKRIIFGKDEFTGFVKDYYK
ncbi:MAG: glycosyltransferase [Candidatus Marinimicrobia bacterium]|nr:glycosyltransferase [Candidatus Neomarinimicrobiota bacterium]